MVKLIATDIDGTLIQDSTPDLYPEMVDAIRELTADGVIFCATSGRQFHSIKHVFRDVADKIVFIAENGAHIRCFGRDVAVTAMDRDTVKGILKELLLYEKGRELIISTTQGSLISSRDKAFLDMLQFGYHNRVIPVDNLMEAAMQAVGSEHPVVKLSIWQKGSVREVGEKILVPHWKDRVKATMAGEEWVDFMAKGVDKGNALTTMREFFGIKKEECMAFGDNANDIGLLQAAGESYAVANAREEVKAAAKHLCPPYWEKGVYQVLKKQFELY